MPTKQTIYLCLYILIPIIMIIIIGISYNFKNRVTSEINFLYSVTNDASQYVCEQELESKLFPNIYQYKPIRPSHP